MKPYVAASRLKSNASKQGFARSILNRRHLAEQNKEVPQWFQTASTAAAALCGHPQKP